MCWGWGTLAGTGPFKVPQAHFKVEILLFFLNKLSDCGKSLVNFYSYEKVDSDDCCFYVGEDFQRSLAYHFH